MNKQKGGSHVVDDCCRAGNFVAAGWMSSYTIGGFIHILLVIAIVVILIRVIGGRKPL
jgi:hypothetical protein